MNVHVQVDVVAGTASADALGVLTAVRRAGVPVTAVVMGHQVDDALSAVIDQRPAQVMVFDDISLTLPGSSARRSVVEAIVDATPAGLWLATTTTQTIDIAGALAGRGVGVAWGLIDVRASDVSLTGVCRTPADALIDIAWTTAWGVGLFHPRAHEPAVLDDPGEEPPPVTVRWLDVPAGIDRRVNIVETAAAVGGGELASAKVIVAAGRGIGDRSRLDLIAALAQRLHGVVGVSLPLVEMGWAPRSMQVGQTGTVVAPDLYVACGISGQIQHRVGMERSAAIIAINTNAEAPIMRWCDLAVVADVGDVLPRLIDLLDSLEGNGP